MKYSCNVIPYFTAAKHAFPMKIFPLGIFGVHAIHMFLSGKTVLKGVGSFIWCLGFLLLGYSVVHICTVESFSLLFFILLIF